MPCLATAFGSTFQGTALRLTESLQTKGMVSTRYLFSCCLMIIYVTRRLSKAIQPLDVKEQGLIQDKELRQIMIDPLPKGSTLYCIMDCCHSGDMLDMRYVYDEQSQRMESDNTIRPAQGEAVMISGCMSVQESADLPPGLYVAFFVSLPLNLTTFYPLLCGVTFQLQPGGWGIDRDPISDAAGRL